MCWNIKVNGKWCRSVGELRKAVYPNTDAIAWHGGYHCESGCESHGGEECLCPVDKEATAAKLGLTAHHLEDGDWVFG